MRNRSWLVLPAPCETGLAAAIEAGTDVIVLDLEHADAAAARREARELAGHWLGVHRHRIVERGAGRWVRINALDTGHWRDDLAAVMPGAPDGIVLPRSAGPDAIRQLAAELYELEQQCRLPSGSTRILPLVGDTPRAALTIASHIDAPHQRLAGLGWEPGRLAAELGAVRTQRSDGGWSDVFRAVRTQTLLAARVCGVAAVDAPVPPVAGEDAIRAAASDACGDGFSGIFASDAAQVAIIHAAFATAGGPAADADEGELDHGVGFEESGLLARKQFKPARRPLGQESRGSLGPILRSA